MLPLALSAWQPKRFAPLAVAAGVAVIVVAFSQTGVMQRRDLASTDIMQLLASSALDHRCEQTIDALLEARVVLERPARNLVVDGERWDQLPAQIHEAVVTCANQVAGVDPATGELPLVRR